MKRITDEIVARERLADNELRSEIDQALKSTKFRTEKTKIASESGNLPDEEGLSLGGLTITDNGREGKYKRYGITHQKSGLAVADDYDTLKAVKIAAMRLSGILDWTQSEEAVLKDVPKGMRLFINQMRNDPYVDYPDDMKDFLKGEPR